MKKLTVQRQAILDLINRSNQHWDADEVVRCLSDHGHQLGIATVYRGLAALEEAGLIQSIQLSDKKRYERADKGHHDHLVCVSCGEIEEFCDSKIEQQQHQVAKQHLFQMTGHQLLIFGSCQLCIEKQKGEQII